MQSTKCADDILETANSKARPIEVPSVVAGYMADLIIHMAKYKKSKLNNKDLLTNTRHYSNGAGNWVSD